MKYLIYCRKSTDTEDKQVLSLESQENELKRLAEANKLNVAGILRESMSAKSIGRPVFNRMLKMIASGKADAIICWKLDRLARNMVDGGQVMDLLQKSVIQEIRTYESVHVPSDNVLMLAVHFGMANQYIRDLSVNVKRGNRAKLDRGEWPNHAPFGYLNDKATKRIVIDPDRGRYVPQIFELYATGNYGFNAMRELMYERGLRTRTGKKVLKSHIQRILKCVFYTGIMERDGKYYQGNHEPLISKQLFDDAQRVMEGNSRPRPKRLFFPLRGFLTCASCGCLLTASVHKGHQYYYCTNGKGNCTQHKVYLREEDAYKLVANLFDDLIFTDRKIELMYRAAKEDTEKNGGEQMATLSQLNKILASLLEKESKLLDAFLAEQITKELYDRKVSEVQFERIALNTQIREAEKKQGVSTLEPTKKLFKQANTAKKEFLAANDAKKRVIVSELLWNLSLENKLVRSLQYKTPFDVIAKAPKKGDLNTMLGIVEDVRTRIQRQNEYIYMPDFRMVASEV